MRSRFSRACQRVDRLFHSELTRGDVLPNMGIDSDEYKRLIVDLGMGVNGRHAPVTDREVELIVDAAATGLLYGLAVGHYMKRER